MDQLFFMTKWNTFSEEKKNNKYSKFMSHKVNFSCTSKIKNILKRL